MKANKSTKRTKIRAGLYRYEHFWGQFNEVELEKKGNNWHWISTGIDDNGNNFNLTGVSDSKKQAIMEADKITEKHLHGDELELLYESL